MELDKSIQSKIMKDAIKNLKKFNIHRETNLYINKNILEGNKSELVIRDLIIPIERDSVYVFSDLEPRCNWLHPCRYDLYDIKTGDKYKTINASTPPSICAANADPHICFYRSVKSTDINKDTTYSPKDISPKSDTLTRQYRERYAILYAGLTENRHLNDLEFLYRTLIDIYGFKKENIYVCNHEGKLTYFKSNGSFLPVSETVDASKLKWPGDNTHYRIQVNYPGTRAGFQQAVNDIAQKIKQDDLLIIHTNSHGGGPCDSSDKETTCGNPCSEINSDYFLFDYDENISWKPYNASDFVNNLQMLPKFKTLVVMMEQCRSGGFIDLIVNKNFADFTHVATSVSKTDYSVGGDNFNSFSYNWISKLNGKDPYGINVHEKKHVSVSDAFEYAKNKRSSNGEIARRCTYYTPPLDFCVGDSPTASDNPKNCSLKIFLR